MNRGQRLCLRRLIKNKISSQVILAWIEEYLFGGNQLRVGHREPEIGRCPIDSIPVDRFVDQDRLRQALTYQSGFGK